ncbi:hypothetical protein A8E90_27050 [Burkholderia cenocepacia]|nr:hypothetical protein A8E90_27050 [Burkholderia cenocepacia]
MPRARARGIHVTTTPDVLTDDVADMALGLILMTLRDLGAGERIVRAGAEVAQGHQDQPQRHVGDVVGQHVGGRGHVDAARPGALEIDRIGADAVDRDDLERVEPVHQRGGQAVRAARHDAANARRHAIEQRVRLLGRIQPMHGVAGGQFGVDGGGQRLGQQDVDGHEGLGRRARRGPCIRWNRV